jgi:hypothetical protein
MTAHKGPASLRPRCTRSGSSVAAIPVYQSTHKSKRCKDNVMLRGQTKVKVAEADIHSITESS